MSIASSWITGLFMTSVSFVARVCVALLAREPLKYQHFAEPLLHRLCRRSAPSRAGRHIAVNYADARNLCTFADRDVSVKANARAQNNKILKRRTTRNSGLSNDNAMSADAHIVAYLNQVVDLGALADDRVTDGATVHRCSGSDFNVILNDNAANLRHFEMSVAAHHKAKSILPYIASRMHNDPVANQSVA